MRAFTYALAPLTENNNPVKKKRLVTDDVQGDHVRVHRLEASEKLSEIVAQYRGCKQTKAIVVVNTTDSRAVDPAHLEGLEASKFPVLIVTQTDGREIMDILEREDDGVVCDIDVESAVDAPTHHQQQLTQAIVEQPRAGGKGGASSQDSKSSGIICMYRNVHAYIVVRTLEVIERRQKNCQMVSTHT